MSKSKSSADLRCEFGHWLKEQRKARRITQESTAKKSGLTVTQISRIENGRSSTRRDTVILLAGIIGINETEALRHFAPESFPQFPEELENVSFSEFTKQELREIADFINFKLAQKRLEHPTEKELGEPISYRIENGKLTPEEKKETKNKEKGHTNQKPPE